jgi:hypothetical protein
MLAHDPLKTGETFATTPLFRDPATGDELTYDFAKAELRDALHRAGYPTLARGCILCASEVRPSALTTRAISLAGAWVIG